MIRAYGPELPPYVIHKIEFIVALVCICRGPHTISSLCHDSISLIQNMDLVVLVSCRSGDAQKYQWKCYSSERCEL